MPADIDKLSKATAEALKVAPQLYNDVLKPSAQENGKLLGRIPKLINAALAPLDIWILNKEYNVNETKKILAKKLENISPEKIVSPEPYVAVPAIQAISYSMNSEELRNMYANLIANSMNIDEKENVHPAFVEIIKQLSPLEARILKSFFNKRKPILPIVKVRRTSDEKDTSGIDYKLHIVEPYFGICMNNIDNFSIAIENLMRLNLILVKYDESLTNKSLYLSIKNSPLVSELKKQINSFSQYNYCTLKEGILYFTELGTSFMKICIL